MTASAPALHIRELATAELGCQTRLPFRFGAVTVTEAPLLHLRAAIDIGGTTVTGMASDLLVPKWFCKDVERAARDDQEALRQSVRIAAERYRSQDGRPVFEQWELVQRELVEDEFPTTPGLLERGFGIALIERALIDAACRHAGMSFAAALPSGLLGRRFERPAPPLPRIAVRHTVGRLDPLRRSDIAASDRLDDGMPQALDAVLAEHGVRWLKIKIGGGLDNDVERLSAIGALLTQMGLADVKVTLDGNEQFSDLDALRTVWRRAAENAHGRSLLERVQWVEQPLPRLWPPADPDHRGDRPDWPHGPLVLDEADAQRRTWRESGYDGVSVKNCKGVFRALLNAEYAAAHPDRFQTSEDLTNLPALAVQQDLATATALGLTHTERNGHHYFKGLDHLPAAATDAVVAAHPDLYERHGEGARLGIRGGMLAIGSLQCPGYGAEQAVIDVLARELEWTAI